MSLTRLLARRMALGAVQVFGVVTIVFLLTEALPGDAAVVIAGDAPDPERIAQLRAALGLDDPLGQRYIRWWGELLRGDLGTSLVSGRPVADTLRAGLAPTALLAGVTFLLLPPLATMLGVAAARRPGSVVDRLISSVSLGFYSVPEFASAILLISLFALQLSLLPANALGVSDLLAQPSVLVLPVAVLLIRPLCSVSRLVRAGLVDARQSDYARHLGRIGLSERRITWAHALPTSGAPAVQQVARAVDWLLGGVIVVEAVFVIPGLGTTLVDAVGTRDVPVVQGLAVFFGLVTVVVNVVADAVSYRMNPAAVTL
ncbi:ABC transporter permease [Occultella aeris]|uniref:Glutathione transport system permease protein GsiC n=1 Tax=Occultella aeris TaxID=2761496 RepID=A0A7M4DIB1_9MICO|nr:ABC transporter permease [Occultella aeris]VZO36681.1 Glutathione transport system permease protein GsiC [Occultella aeris]